MWDAKDAILEHNAMRGGAAQLIAQSSGSSVCAASSAPPSTEPDEFLVEQIEMYCAQALEGDKPLNAKAIVSCARELHRRVHFERERREKNHKAKQRYKVKCERLGVAREELSAELSRLKRSDMAHYHFKISMLEAAFSEDIKIFRAVYGSDSMVALEKLTTPSSLDGYLLVQAKGKKTWKQYWCLLRDNFIVMYPGEQKKWSMKKSTSEGLLPVRVVRVDENSIIRALQEEQCGKPNAFCVFRRSVGYNFAADSLESMEEWMDGLTLPRLHMWWEKITAAELKPRTTKTDASSKLESKLTALGYDEKKRDKIKRML